MYFILAEVGEDVMTIDAFTIGGAIVALALVVVTLLASNCCKE